MLDFTSIWAAKMRGFRIKDNIENSDTHELVKPIVWEGSKEIMDDIYNMIEEFNKQGWCIKEISTITGYPEEDINKFKEE